MSDYSRFGRRSSRGQALVEFALIAPIAMMVILIGIQIAMIGEAALAVSQGTTAVARYAAINPGTVGPNGNVTLTTAIKQLLSPSILSNSGKDLTITIASYTGTTTNTTSSPQYTDRLNLTISYSATSKIALPNPFFGITFPTTLNASVSQMYE